MFSFKKLVKLSIIFCASLFKVNKVSLFLISVLILSNVCPDNCFWIRVNHYLNRFLNTFNKCTTSFVRKGYTFQRFTVFWCINDSLIVFIYLKFNVDWKDVLL